MVPLAEKNSAGYSMAEVKNPGSNSIRESRQYATMLTRLSRHGVRCAERVVVVSETPSACEVWQAMKRSLHGP